MENLVACNRLSYQVCNTFEPLEAEWRALETAPECSIHQTYDWCRIWVEETGCRPLIIAATFADGENRGEMAFILPLAILARGPAKIARYMSAPFNNLNFGLFSDKFRELASPDLMRDIKKQLTAGDIGVDLIVLDRQPATWRGATHPFVMLPSVENQNHAFQVTLTEDFTAVLARGNAKRRRKKFRNSERRLDDLGGYQYVKGRTVEDAHDLLDEFFNQKAARFEFHGLPDAFTAPATKAFFHQLAKESIGNSQSMIEMHAIRLNDGTICAVSALSRKAGHVICQFSSILMGKTEHASPGELLFYLMIHDACESGAELFDFGIGDEQFKRSWCDLDTAHYDTVIPVTAIGHLAAMVTRIIVNGKRITKSNPAMFRWAKALRFSLKR